MSATGTGGEFERLFPGDRMRKRERVEAALAHQPVDRVPLLEQLSYNPRVLAAVLGRPITGFAYGVPEVCEVIRRCTDLIMPPVAPRGRARVTTSDGFVIQHDEWTSWHVSRPFNDVAGACAWLRGRTAAARAAPFDAAAARACYRRGMLDLQAQIGETVILNYSGTGFCGVFFDMGLELYTFFVEQYPEVLTEYLEVQTAREEARVHAVADRALSPVILIPEDFSTKHGPIFSPTFLERFHYPYVRRLAAAWHEHDITALYHSDGNYRLALPALIACGVDGFYCLEPGCGMDAVEFKRRWPQMVWAGGIDGVDLMERGTPAQVRAAVRRQIVESDALRTGGLFIASSSEINPPIPPENFLAMVAAVGATTVPTPPGVPV